MEGSADGARRLEYQYNIGGLSKNQRTSLNSGEYDRKSLSRLLNVWESQHRTLKARAKRFFEEKKLVPETADEWNALCKELEWELFRDGMLGGWPADSVARKHLAYWDAGTEILRQTSCLLTPPNRIFAQEECVSSAWKQVRLSTDRKHDRLDWRLT